MKRWSPRAWLANCLRWKLLVQRIKERSRIDPVSDGPTLNLNKQADSLPEGQNKNNMKERTP